MEKEVVNFKGLEYVFSGESGGSEEDYTCPICRGILVNPKVTSCGHTFCGECIDQAITSYEGDSNDLPHNSFPCPVDRISLDPAKDLTAPPYLVTSLLNNLTVKCPFTSRGCSFTGPRWTLDNHLDNDCLYIKVKCMSVPYDVDLESDPPMEDTICGLMTERRYLVACITENGSCCHEFTECELCHDKVLRAALDEHLASSCPKSTLICSLCSRSVGAKDMNSHMADYCPESIVTCTAASYGCPWTGIRKESQAFQDHLKSCQLVVLMPVLAKQESRMNALEKENQLLRYHVNRLESGVRLQRRSANTGTEDPQSDDASNDQSLSLNAGSHSDSGSHNMWTDRDVQYLFVEGEALRRDTDGLRRRIEEIDLKQCRFILQESQRMSDDINSLRLIITGLRGQLNFLLTERNISRNISAKNNSASTALASVSESDSQNGISRLDVKL